MFSYSCKNIKQIVASDSYMIEVVKMNFYREYCQIS